MEISKDSKDIIQLGSGVLGGVASNIISQINGIDQVSSVGCGILITKVLNDLSSRVLSNKERARVGAATIACINKISSNLDQGKIINENFYNSVHEDYKSSSEELYEGIMIKAKNEYEERKIRHIGAILWQCIICRRY
ncbi:hypothetical protein GS399_00885 [Pedobacter sp. HMF7647]|uniref:Uncharacterized protein n=1 Tax=Hufsiella arboris TaxID=2695275 RepID=A0A7K1Y575_9SPHI|nr:hypothetical protein [Hufsiella arboris]MXV49511.1 hypothetical protein [Hufsiella arboris]